MEQDDALFIGWEVTPALRPWVQRIVGFHDPGSPAIRRELLTVGCPMLFVFGAPYRLSDRANPGVISATHRSFTAGVFDTYTASQATGPTSCIQVDLTPLGARLLSGVPMHEFANLILPMDDLWGREMRDVAERLGNLDTWPERFRLIESTLLARLWQGADVDREVVWAWDQLVASHGAVRIGLLTDELQWSRKRLRHAFLRDIGFSPKTMARMLRYRHAVDLSLRAPDTDWSAIAHGAGYSDQAHLHRDVRAFAGTTPVALRSELRGETFVQAIDAASR